MNHVSCYSIAWLAWLAAFGVVEGIAILKKRWSGTLTEQTRKLFHTDSRKGRLAFAVTWSMFGLWFLGHVLHWWP